jgi:hypothetical protein
MVFHLDPYPLPGAQRPGWTAWSSPCSISDLPGHLANYRKGDGDGWSIVHVECLRQAPISSPVEWR